MNQKDIIFLLKRSSARFLAWIFISLAATVLFYLIYTRILAPLMAPDPFYAFHIIAAFVCLFYGSRLFRISWRLDRAVEGLDKGESPDLGQSLPLLKQAEAEARRGAVRKLWKYLFFCVLLILAELHFFRTAYTISLGLYDVMLYLFYRLVEGRFRRKLEDVLLMDAV